MTRDSFFVIPESGKIVEYKYGKQGERNLQKKETRESTESPELQLVKKILILSKVNK